MASQLFRASPGSFQSCRGENHPDPKSGQEVDLDKPGCTTYLHRYYVG